VNKLLFDSHFSWFQSSHHLTICLGVSTTSISSFTEYAHFWLHETPASTHMVTLPIYLLTYLPTYLPKSLHTEVKHTRQKKTPKIKKKADNLTLISSRGRNWRSKMKKPLNSFMLSFRFMLLRPAQLNSAGQPKPTQIAMRCDAMRCNVSPGPT